MKSLIPRAKLRPPRLRERELQRPDLLASLDRGLVGQFTLVSAPAGYGKTTLISQWIAQQELPAAWLSLEEDDNELSVFLRDLIASIRLVTADCCPATAALLGGVGPMPIDLLIRELANDLDELDDFILVLDDCHRVSDSDVLAILRHLALQSPGPLHLVISTRADPMISLGSLRGRGLMNEVRAADLRLNMDEAAHYLQQALGQSLAESQVAALVSRTEGWIAGLHLAVLSLRGREDLDERIQELAGSDRYIADYLMEELLDRIDPALQRYLMATSILERLNPSLCQAVAGEQSLDSIDGRPVLEWLQDSNLFIFSLDDQREWFRYHNLFQELLRHWLIATWPREEVDALHVRAGRWLADHYLVDEALGHFLAVRRMDLAQAAVEEHSRDAIERAQWRTLERWVRKLGDEVDTRPRLVMIHVWLAHERVDLAEIARHCDRVEQLLVLQDPPLDDEAVLRGEIAAMRAETDYWQGNAELALVQARRALTLLPADHRIARGTAIVFEGGALHLLGRRAEAFEVFDRATFGDYGTGVHPRVLLGRALVSFMTGDVDKARHSGELMLSRGTALGLDELVGIGQFLLGFAAYHRDDLSLAEQHFALVEPYRTPVLQTKQAFYCLAWIRLAQGRPDEALSLMDQCLSYVTDLGLSYVAEARLLRARIAALSDRPADEVALARSLLPDPATPLVTLGVCYEYSPYSAIGLLLEEGSAEDLGACELALGHILANAEARDNVFRSVQGLVLQALLFDRQARTLEAVGALRSAVALARPGRLVRLFPEMGGGVLPLLQALHVRGRTDPFLAELMSSFAPTAVTPASLPAHRSSSAQEHPIECVLTNRELDVLELLGERLSNKEIARRLVISPATVKRHTLSIYSKLGVNSRREAAAKSAREGLFPAKR